MANERNLIPITSRPKSEQREIRKKGGRASGRARRLKADIRAAILEQLGDDATLEKLVAAMYREACKGNVQAAVFLRDTAGQKPVDKSETSAKEQHVLSEAVAGLLRDIFTGGGRA